MTDEALSDPGPPSVGENELLSELEDSNDDIGKIKRPYMAQIMPDDEDFNSSQVPIDTITKREVQDLIDSIPKPLIQKPLQPGSTPIDEENRFLCWNNVGIIRAQNEIMRRLKPKKNDHDDGDDDDFVEPEPVRIFGREPENCIDVIFHDAERHSSINFKNDDHYVFGCLSEDAIVVGSNGRHGTGPAKIHGFNLLEARREQRAWDVELPAVERIDAMTVGSGFVAVATDQRFLRLFTNGGMQSFVFTLPGQVLSVAGHQKQLMIIYHNGSGHADDQNLSMTTYTIDLQYHSVRQVHKDIPVGLGRRSPLAWSGFSDEGSPCTYDYSGMVRIYRPDLGKTWVPVLNMKELTSSALDNFFVVGVNEITQTVKAIKCRRSRYPEFTAETAELFDFNLPMCEMDTDQGRLEEEHVRLRLANMSYKRFSQMDELRSTVLPACDANEKLLVNNVLRLFSTYLKEEKEDLAKNLVYMIPKEHMSKLPEFAWKINKPQYFIDALNRAIEEREQMEFELKTTQGDDDSVSVVSVHSHHSFAKDLKRELEKSKKQEDEGTLLKPLPLDKLMTNTVGIDNNNKQAAAKAPPVIEDDSDDQDNENDTKQASKRTKSINYNLFSKNKRSKIN